MLKDQLLQSCPGEPICALGLGSEIWVFVHLGPGRPIWALGLGSEIWAFVHLHSWYIQPHISVIMRKILIRLYA